MERQLNEKLIGIKRTRDDDNDDMGEPTNMKKKLDSIATFQYIPQDVIGIIMSFGTTREWWFGGAIVNKEWRSIWMDLKKTEESQLMEYYSSFKIHTAKLQQEYEWEYCNMITKTIKLDTIENACNDLQNQIMKLQDICMARSVDIVHSTLHLPNDIFFKHFDPNTIWEQIKRFGKEMKVSDKTIDIDDLTKYFCVDLYVRYTGTSMAMFVPIPWYRDHICTFNTSTSRKIVVEILNAVIKNIPCSPTIHTRCRHWINETKRKDANPMTEYIYHEDQ